MHGQGSNAIHFEHQLRSLKKLLDDDIEFVFLDAPIVFESPYLEQFYDMDFYSWFETINTDKTEHELQIAVQYLINKIEQIGKIDAVVGFSQSGMLIEHMERMCLAQKLPKMWNLSIMYSCITVKTILGQSHSTELLPFNNIYIYGEKEPDNIKEIIPNLYEKEKQQVLVHDLGHDIPSDILFTKSLTDAIKSIIF